MAAPDTRTVTLVDIPLLRRLSGGGTILDSETGLTRDARGAKSSLLSSILFSRGIYTLVARSDAQQVVGQFRYRPGDSNAHIVYLAPSLDVETENTAWLHILDAMAREAGRHGAHAIVAEVEPDNHIFETMRMARFAVYARQTIWKHAPLKLKKEDGVVDLRLETPSDQIGVWSLINSTIPPMLQQITAPQNDVAGWVYRRNGTVEAYLSLTCGTHGIYVLPYIHPDVMHEAADILMTAIALTEQAHRVPVYVCVRSYQCWLHSILETLAFESWIEQAIMVKHIAAGVRSRAYDSLKVKTQQIETVAVPQSSTSTWRTVLPYLSDEKRETS